MSNVVNNPSWFSFIRCSLDRQKLNALNGYCVGLQEIFTRLGLTGEQCIYVITTLCCNPKVLFLGSDCVIPENKDSLPASQSLIKDSDREGFFTKTS